MVTANEFINTNRNICIKSLDSSSPVFEGITYPFHTVELTQAEKSQHLSLVQNCPTMFQQFINKKFDLRVAVFGTNVYAVEIHSQERPESSQDFRLVSPDLLEHRIHSVPPALSNKIIAFMRHFNLAFFSI